MNNILEYSRVQAKYSINITDVMWDFLQREKKIDNIILEK